MVRCGAFIGCMALFVSILATPITAATYTVGDSNGWALGVDYTTWAYTKTFNIGDSLVFNYGNTHSVSEVTSSEYVSCNLRNAMSADTSGATIITLNTVGRHYFVCAAPGHCDGGQKLEVTVSADDIATPFRSPAPSPSGNIASPYTPAITINAPTSTKNNDVPCSSSATSLSPIVVAIFFMACGV